MSKRQSVFRVAINFASEAPVAGVEQRSYVELIVATELWLVEAYCANRRWLFQQPTVEITDLGTVDKFITVEDGLT